MNKAGNLRHRVSQQQTTSKISRILWAAGFCLCILCAVYMLYLAVSWRAVDKLQMSGKKAVIIAGIIAVAEGEVVRAEDGHTIIRYYHEWDGTDYKRVLFHAKPAYQEGVKVPVAYTLGMGAGSCLLVGFYKKAIFSAGMAGIVLVVLGIIINFKKKGIEQNGKKKNYSRQLEDEYDAQ